MRMDTALKTDTHREAQNKLACHWPHHRTQGQKPTGKVSCKTSHPSKFYTVFFYLRKTSNYRPGARFTKHSEEEISS